VTLYIPWRNESTFLERAQCNSYTDYVQTHDAVSDTIKAKAAEYTKGLIDWDEALQTAEEQARARVQDVFDRHDPDACAKRSTKKRKFEHDIAVDLGLNPEKPFTVTYKPRFVKDSEYRGMMRNLNKDQRLFHDHFIASIVQEPKKQLVNFISSTTVRCIEQSVLRQFRVDNDGVCCGEDDNNEGIPLLIVAPTGKSAFNIGGVTVHGGINIPANQGLAYRPLHKNAFNTAVAKFRNLKVLIIDEISMVGAGMLSFINQRLQEVKGNKLPFGGVHVLFCGDLFQLPPVMDAWCFNQPKPDSSALSALAPNIWRDTVCLFELTEIMRQEDRGERVSRCWQLMPCLW
jgi:hypothetical protein